VIDRLSAGQMVDGRILMHRLAPYLPRHRLKESRNPAAISTRTQILCFCGDGRKKWFILCWLRWLHSFTGLFGGVRGGDFGEDVRKDPACFQLHAAFMSRKNTRQKCQKPGKKLLKTRLVAGYGCGEFLPVGSPSLKTIVLPKIIVRRGWFIFGKICLHEICGAEVSA
jgi:hypothetical protein